MNKESIHWNDWYRILIGSAPGFFLIEVFLRTVIMFLVLLVVLRLMGKRMGGQLTIAELAVMLTLGAIICVPMQLPDRGILQGILVLVCALFFQRGLTLMGVRNSKMEKVIQGKESIIVKNGMLQIKELYKANISRQQIYGILRSQNIYNLGEVERIYLEACGLLSVFKFAKPQPGLCITPVEDPEVMKSFRDCDEMVCRSCGKTAENSEEQNSNCNNCNSKDWKHAILNQ